MPGLGRNPFGHISGNGGRTWGPGVDFGIPLELGLEGFSTIEVDKTCDQVRRRLQNLLDNNEYKTKRALCEELDCSETSFNTFMKQQGRDKGSGSACYTAGLELLQKRARQGLKDPRAKPGNSKKRTSDGDEHGSAAKRSKAADGVPDVSDVMLEGEFNETVPVFDTCNELRRKINAHLKIPSVSQAAFLRELSAQSKGNISAQTLNTFRRKKGPDGGKSSPVFYPAYVYFEKLRIKEGKKKSKIREEMEQVWGSKGWGVNRRSVADSGIWAHKSENFFVDKYGKLHIQRPGEPERVYN